MVSRRFAGCVTLVVVLGATFYFALPLIGDYFAFDSTECFEADVVVRPRLMTENTIELALFLDSAESNLQTEIRVSNASHQESHECTLYNEEEAILSLTGLSPNTTYAVEVTSPESSSLKTSLKLRTFAGLSDCVEFFYLVDASRPHNHLVPVTVLGRFDNFPMEALQNGYYQSHGAAHITEDPVLHTDYEIELSFNEFNRIAIDFQENEGYFTLYYTSNKSYRLYEGDSSYGYFCDEYLMTTWEQILFEPVYHGFNGYLMVPPEWVIESGVQPGTDGIMQFMFGGGFNCYAYNPDYFNIQAQNINGTEVVTILSKAYVEDYSSDIFSVVVELTQIWGDSVGDRYVVMFANGSRNVFGGEWTTGQAMVTSEATAGITTHEIIGQTLVHQTFHRWNDWVLGTRFEHSEEYSSGFYIEGFNEFYCDVVLKNLGYDEKIRLQGRYDDYKSFRGTAADVPLLTPDHEVDNGDDIFYCKGGIFAYALDKEVRERTDGNHSLDDLLKHLWERWTNHWERPNYDRIVSYLNSIVPGGIDDWWQYYVVENHELILDELE